MDANTKYTLFVFNTCTQKYEEVTVSEEVYRTYCRTGWNIKDNDQSFFDHEIQLSGMIGSQDGAYENFREFVDSVDTPENIVLSQIEKEALYQAISALPTKSRSLVQGLFFDGLSEYEYADILGVSRAAIARYWTTRIWSGSVIWSHESSDCKRRGIWPAVGLCCALGYERTRDSQSDSGHDFSLWLDRAAPRRFCGGASCYGRSVPVGCITDTWENPCHWRWGH